MSSWHRQQPTRLCCPWDSPGKNTRVGCYYLLQCMKVKSESEVAQSCPPLSDPMDYSPPGSPVHGIFLARILEWFAISFSRGYSWPRDQTPSPALAGGFFTTELAGLIASLLLLLLLKSLQSCPTLCDPRDGSPPGSPIPGILQARTLERVTISFSNTQK